VSAHSAARQGRGAFTHAQLCALKAQLVIARCFETCAALRCLACACSSRFPRRRFALRALALFRR
jgi:hypothetical protein